jgi:hypothetical protein
MVKTDVTDRRGERGYAIFWFEPGEHSNKEALGRETPVMERAKSSTDIMQRD